MCTVELKKAIYKEFDNGLNVTEVIEKLNIPNEKRVVNGCYTWWKQKKDKNNYGMDNVEKQNKKLLSICDEYFESIEKVLNGLTELIEVSNEIDLINAQNMDTKYELLRQVILHDIEHQELYEPNPELYYKLKVLSEGRRITKGMQTMNEPVKKNVDQFKKICNIFQDLMKNNTYGKKAKEKGKDFDFSIAFIAKRMSHHKRDSDFMNMLIDCVGIDRFKMINTISNRIKDEYILDENDTDVTNNITEKVKQPVNVEGFTLNIGDECIYKKDTPKEKRVTIYNNNLDDERCVEVRITGTNTYNIVRVKDLTKVN